MFTQQLRLQQQRCIIARKAATASQPAAEATTEASPIVYIY
jgi:hypothetical protein